MAPILDPLDGQDSTQPSRREILKLGVASGIGLKITELGPSPKLRRSTGPSCIMIMMVGGPSQIDTWDLKPRSASEFRGPFRPIATNVPGIEISEIFPRTARIMDRVALLRSVHHQAVPVHEAGQQMVQTGRFSMRGVEHPHPGSVLARLSDSPGNPPRHVILGGRLGPMGGNMASGQGSGYLGEEYGPFVIDSPDRGSRLSEASGITGETRSTREAYGRTRFGENCLLARRLIESGVRFITINMYQTVYHEASWDCHGAAPFTRLDAYGTEVGPDFDRSYSALILDLERRGLLGSTMVLALGEFGRTPRINAQGGRDHHPGCSSAILAGGRIRGGQVIGASCSVGHEPIERQVSPAEITATIYQHLGLDLDGELDRTGGCPIRLVDSGVEPIQELF